MGWEREHHHINLVEGHHVIGLIERNVLDANGEPARYLIQILLGHESFDVNVGHQSIAVKLGGDLTIQNDGTLQDAKGNVFDPRHIERDMIHRLNAHHAAMRSYAKKHGAPELKVGKAR